MTLWTTELLGAAGAVLAGTLIAACGWTVVVGEGWPLHAAIITAAATHTATSSHRLPHLMRPMSLPPSGNSGIGLVLSKTQALSIAQNSI
jgi:hypothetical protein